MSETIQLVDLLKSHPELTLTATGGHRNDTSDWKRYSWKVTVSLDNGQGLVKSLVTDFHTGIGHAKPQYKAAYVRNGVHFSASGDAIPMVPTKPTLADVLWNLASDASACDTTFEDWCSDLGYDSDSRKALNTFLACQATGSELMRLLGRELFEAVRSAEH